MANKNNFFTKMNIEPKLLMHGSGFTLIELLVVISIIGLLASVVLVSLNGARAKSRDAKRISDMNQMAKAMELYFNDYNTYPTVGTTGKGFTTAGLVIGQPSLAGGANGKISKLPVPPLPKDGTCSAVLNTPGSNEYYIYPTTQATTNSYYITFCLGDKTGSLSAGPHTLTQGGFQ